MRSSIGLVSDTASTRPSTLLTVETSPVSVTAAVAVVAAAATVTVIVAAAVALVPVVVAVVVVVVLEVRPEAPSSTAATPETAAEVAATILIVGHRLFHVHLDGIDGLFAGFHDVVHGLFGFEDDETELLAFVPGLVERELGLDEIAEL